MVRKEPRHDRHHSTHVLVALSEIQTTIDFRQKEYHRRPIALLSDQVLKTRGDPFTLPLLQNLKPRQGKAAGLNFPGQGVVARQHLVKAFGPGLAHCKSLSISGSVCDGFQ